MHSIECSASSLVLVYATFCFWPTLYILNMLRFLRVSLSLRVGTQMLSEDVALAVELSCDRCGDNLSVTATPHGSAPGAVIASSKSYENLMKAAGQL